VLEELLKWQSTCLANAKPWFKSPVSGGKKKVFSTR
jgi:hypothetical protein